MSGDHARLAAAARALAVCALALAALAGCGGVRAADLFLVSRSGSTPHARLTLLVNEEGSVHCNGGPTLKLSDPQLVQARAIQEEIHDAASRGLSLPARAGSIFAYTLRDESGSVRFSDNSAAQPVVLRHLQLFVLQVAQQVCHLPAS
ncbi:MAG TPA: hypothetical protein VGN13_04175 [Solirubrobacteraceae bacterium]